MLESLTSSNEFKYQKLSLEEQQSRGILGRLKGIIADFKNPTRNGRLYSEELWDKVFENPIVTEKLNCRTIFGELGHPADRTETDMEKIAVCLAEEPVKNSKGQLMGVFDILDTPNGRILKTLCDYGTNIGISSRGSGDIITDRYGQEAVDPNSYEFECFDIVIIPAVKAARLDYVTETLDTKKYNKTLREKLVEEFDRASENDKRVLKETFKNLSLNVLEEDDDFETVLSLEDMFRHISKDDDFVVFDNNGELTPDAEIHKNGVIANYFGGDEGEFNVAVDAAKYAVINDVNRPFIEEETITNDCSNIEVQPELAVVDDEADLVIEELQETLKHNRELEEKIIELNEQLSVCYAKGADNTELSAKLDTTAKLLSQARHQNYALNGKLQQANESLQKLTDKNKMLEAQIKELKTTQTSKLNSVTEAYNKQKEVYAETVESSKKLSEDLANLQKENASLQEAYANLKKDSAQSKQLYSQSSMQSKQLIEKYKGIAFKAVDKYIDSQAIRLGVTGNEIKNRLPENYNFKTIDKVCEDIQNAQLNIGRLPFKNLDLKENMGIRLSNNADMAKQSSNPADEIDASLINLAKMFNK